MGRGKNLPWSGISQHQKVYEIAATYTFLLYLTVYTPISLYFPVLYVQIPYRRLKYQLKANWCVSGENGLGTSLNPGLATGCLKYTAAQIL